MWRWEIKDYGGRNKRHKTKEEKKRLRGDKKGAELLRGNIK